VLDLQDLAVVGMATTKMLAEGCGVTPEMLPALLDRDRRSHQPEPNASSVFGRHLLARPGIASVTSAARVR
jgi:hypothetical protein